MDVYRKRFAIGTIVGSGSGACGGHRSSSNTTSSSRCTVSLVLVLSRASASTVA